MSNLFDTANAPTTEPVQIIAGDYTAWKRADLGSDYPNSTYTLKYHARSEGVPAREIEISAAADGADYLVELPSATTGAYTVANYHWDAFIVRNADSERVRIDSGLWSVVADKATSSDDPRTLPLKMLAAIEQALLNRADNHQLDVLAYDLGVEASATRNPEKLLDHRRYWQRELVKANQRARARKGQGHSGTIKVRFK